MTTFGKFSCLAALLLAIAAPVQAGGDAARGKELSTTCAACHGADGTSPAPDFPSIGGQHPDYLARALMDYKSGARQNPIMSGQVATLSKQDMQDLAAYFGLQKGLYHKR